MLPFTDPLLVRQWYLRNTGQTGGIPGIDLNLAPLRGEYRGRGVRVLVIDTGIDYSHPDLARNYSQDADRAWTSPVSDGYPISGNAHGTAIAGIIAADDDGVGIVGIAPDATLTAYRLGVSASGSLSGSDAGYAYAASFDVINASFGIDSGFIDNVFNPASQSSLDAIVNAVTRGRGGLGSIVVKAAGNALTRGADSNLSATSSSINTITVGAVDRNGRNRNSVNQPFSTPGASVLVSAPGTGIYTTDIVGSSGYTLGDFGPDSLTGTSFAAPMVAGVAALMLEANPRLGYRDVMEILAASARETDSLNGDWRTNGARDWNGGGMHFSRNYGFGLVDAHAAVRLAETWSLSQVRTNLGIVTASANAVGTIPAGGASTTFTISASNFKLDHVRVQLDLSFTSAQDLHIRLRSPAGTVSDLLYRPSIDPVSGSVNTDILPLGPINQQIQLTSVHFWGESSVGTWTIEILDANRVGVADSGVLRSATLVMTGSESTADNVYIYTDEYTEYYSPTSARRTLSDNGGYDVFNAAAVTGNSLIDLRPGRVGRIAGSLIVISETTLIEKAIGGDGADTMFAADEGGELLGMRGNDILTGGTGNDILTGGTDNDSINGGDGFDIATFAGTRSAYTITSTNGAVVILGPDGNDSLVNVERIRFADQSILLNPPAWQTLNDTFGVTIAGQSATISQVAITPLTDPTRGTLVSRVQINGQDVQGVPPTLKQGWRVATVSDIDGNGAPEIFFFGVEQVAGVGSGFGATWELGTAGLVQRAQTQFQMRIQGWEVAGAANVNGLTGDEILWQNVLTGAKAIWTDANRDGTVEGGFVIAGLGTSTAERIVGVADLDRDGVRELLLFNDISGALKVMESVGTASGDITVTLLQEFASFATFEAAATAAGAFRTVFGLTSS
jgi:subtilisin-like proprotein convertase family protein